MKRTLEDFREFMRQGDLLALTVALGLALVTVGLIEAFVRAMVTPIIGAIIGEPAFEGFGNLSFEINGSYFFYGVFIDALLSFALVAAAIYFLVIAPGRRSRGQQGLVPRMRSCPECVSAIPAAAKRCPRCTAPVSPELG